MRLGRTHPLSDLIHSELAPGLAADSDVAILASIQSTLDSYYHASSTVPMGPEKDSAANDEGAYVVEHTCFEDFSYMTIWSNGQRDILGTAEEGPFLEVN